MGGVDAVCAAGKAEGQVNIIATPPDWANYGQIITDFTAKYGIKVQSDKPDGNGQDEINAATQLAGTGRQPDIFDIGSSLVAAHTDMFAPYKVATWADIPDANKDVDGSLVQQLHRLRSRSATTPSSATSRRSRISPMQSTRARSR